jgi:dTDP-glucose 4,6-dehydratase
VYNIGSGDERPNLEVAKRILSLTGRPEGLLRHVKDRPGHDRRYAIESTRVRQELGWAPRVPFEDGLAQTIAWFRAHEPWWQEILSGAYQTYYHQQYGERA